MGAVALVMGRSREEAEGRLREQLVKDLGIGGTPELAWALRANVSREEYVKMYEVWREGEEQAEMVKGMWRGWMAGRRQGGGEARAGG